MPINVLAKRMDVPTTAELQDALLNLYDAQTHLIASYEDLPDVLALLPDLHVSLVLITVETPQLVDFKQFTSHLYRNHLGLVRTPPLLTGRDEVLEHLNGVFSLFSLCNLCCPAFLIYFVLVHVLNSVGLYNCPASLVFHPGYHQAGHDHELRFSCSVHNGIYNVLPAR